MLPMTILETLDQFADDLNPTPRFPVEPPDGLKHLSEIKRQTQFINMMKTLAPSVLVFANANAGKRNPMKAKAEGIMGGVFDVCVMWDNGGIAWPEFKGYDAAGRPGKLSRAQIDWGNKAMDRGQHVECFFDAMTAVEWLRSVGCPIRSAR